MLVKETTMRSKEKKKKREALMEETYRWMIVDIPDWETFDKIAEEGIENIDLGEYEHSMRVKRSLVDWAFQTVYNRVPNEDELIYWITKLTS